MTFLPPAPEGNFPIPSPREALAFTGERMTTAMSGQIEYEHLHRYCLARDLCAGRDVLDVASGEGYGSALIAQVARSVVGVELDAASVAHAQASYQDEGRLRFVQGDAMALPLADASVDAVVSFETIEHVPEVAGFLAEILRVLRPGGLLIVSTPDRTVYSAAGQDPNPYHVHEMSAAELTPALQARFRNVVVAAQRPVLGSLLAAPDGAGWRSYERRSPGRAEASAGLARAHYLVALASDAPLPPLPSSVYLDGRRVHDVVEAAAEAPVLRERLAEAARREQEEVLRHREDAAARHADQARALAAASDAHAAALRHAGEAAREREVALEAQLATARARQQELQGAHGRAELAAGELGRTVAQQAAHVAHLGAMLAERAEAWERVHAVLDAERAEAAGLRARLAAAEADRAALRDSVSWQLTAPVRLMGRALRRLRHATRLPARALAGRRLRRKRAGEIAALGATPLFDSAWYAAHTPGLAASGHDPASHYAWIGDAAGHKPNAWFDPGWYRARHLGGAAGVNALLHWVGGGRAQRLDPNPFLDAAWYVEQNPDAAADPLQHYITHGHQAGRDPNPMLDAEALLTEYPAARDSGQDALLHWWSRGVADGLNPHPMFDAPWYALQNALPQGADPLAHWLATGRAARLPTHPALDGPPGPIAFAIEADPDVSIVIPAYAHYADTYRCLQALHANTGPGVRYEVIVADDCPEHRVVPLLSRRIQGVRWVQNPENLGFLRSCNHAESLAVGRYVVFLNNDAVVQPGWLEPLLRLADADPLVGIVGCRLLNADGTLQEAGGTILSNGWGEPYGANDAPDRPEYGFVRQVDVVVGACFLVRRSAFDALGGFDLRYAPAFYEEFDLAFGLREAGYTTWYQPESRVVHLGSNSYGAEQRDRQSLINHGRFCAKWAALLPAQPAPGAPALHRRAGAAAAAEGAAGPPRHALVIDDRVLEWNRQAGALTIHTYIGLLRREGFAVTYCAAVDATPVQPYHDAMRQGGVEVVLGTDELRRWLRLYGDGLDVVWTARPDVAGPLLQLLRGATRAPILYYTHDLHYLRERRRWEAEGDPAALEESKRLKRIELAIFSGVDRVMTPSRIEAAIIAAETPEADTHVIPPYVVPPAPLDVAPAPLTAPPARDCVTFVGGFAHLPNVDAALWLVQEIMPLVWQEAPELRCLVVGHRPPPELAALAGPRVEITGFVEDLAPSYARSLCTVSALRYGAGVKGKIVGSIEAGVPVITTAVGNEGLDLVDGVEALIADTAEGMAAAVLGLRREAGRAAALVRAGQARLRRGLGVGAAQSALQAVLGQRCCRVCGTVTTLGRERGAGPEPQGTENWREAVVCPGCHALSRTEAVADLILDAHGRPGEASLRRIAPRLRPLAIHALDCASPIAAELRGLPHFSCAGPASALADASLDLLISEDMLQHAPDPLLALAECRRVLKPGGRLLLSTPAAPDRHATLPHPVTAGAMEGGAGPVLHDFGRDLADMLAASGFDASAHERVAEHAAGGYLVTYDAVRRA